MTMIRRIAAVTTVAAVLLASSACGDDGGGSSGSGDLTTVKFGYIADYNGGSLLAIADELGLWAKHGVKPEYAKFDNGPKQVAAFESDSLAFGYIGPGALWLPASGKATIVSMNSQGKADRVIAQPGISSIKDLRGKKVAVPDGTSGDMILQMALQKNGMTINDVQKVSMDTNGIVSAFANGDVDAAGIWYPLIDNIKKQKPDLVELAKNADFAPGVVFPTVFVARNNLVKDKPEVVEKVVGVLLEASEERAKDKHIEQVATFLQKSSDIVEADSMNSTYVSNAELSKLVSDGSTEKWLTELNKYFVKVGKLDKAPDAKSYYAVDLWTKAAG